MARQQALVNHESDPDSHVSDSSGPVRETVSG
jgi:hypothetical protein